MLRARHSLKLLTTEPIVMFDHLRASRVKRVTSRSMTPASQPVRELNVLELEISVSPRNPGAVVIKSSVPLHPDPFKLQTSV
jgi:hypothetical protein